MSSDDGEDQGRAERLAALKDLLQHPGWRLLVGQVATEWGDAGYGFQMREALLNVPPGPDRAFEIAQVADRVESTKAAVDAIMTWPTSEITRLSDPKPMTKLGKLRRLTTRS